MTLVKGFLQTLSRETGQPANVLGRLNQLFCANAPSGTFISLIYGVLDVAKGTFTFTRAGHNPVVLKRRDQAEAELIRPSGMAIGLTRGAAFEEAIEEVTVSLQPGDVLALYTDGVSEAVNQAGKQFGTERLAHCIEQAGEQASRTILGTVADEVDRFIEPVGRRDDMTLVVLKYVGERLSGAEPEPADAASSGERKVDRGVT